MIKPALLVRLIKQRLLERRAFVGPIPAEVTSSQPQFVIDAYREAAKNEIAFLEALLEEPPHPLLSAGSYAASNSSSGGPQSC